jgi:hypothetical protein
MEAPKIVRRVNTGTKKSIITEPTVEGKQRQQEIYEQPLENNVFLPQGISVFDIDNSVIDEFKGDLNVNVNGQRLSVFAFSKQRFTEEFQTWLDKDDNNSITLPFVNILREKPVQKGTNFNQVNYNIPSEVFWSVISVEKEDGLKDHYKVPQPISVDLSYTVEYFANTRQDIEMLDQFLLMNFSSAQYYLNVKGYLMPLHLSSLDDISENGLDKRRYFSHKYELEVKGFLLNPDNFIKLDSLNKIKINKIIGDKEECPVKYNYTSLNNEQCLSSLEIIFDRNGENDMTFTSKENLVLTSDNQSMGGVYNLYLNGVLSTFPINVNVGDELRFERTDLFDKRVLIKIYT